MTIKEAFERAGIKCNELSSYEFILTYKGIEYLVRFINSLGTYFTMFNITTQKQLCTRASFRTTCRLIKLGHK